MLHPDTAQALEMIDAGMFSSDTFHDKEDLAELKTYLDRWTRGVEAIEEMHRDSDENL